jgi:hypothetical protein
MANDLSGWNIEDCATIAFIFSPPCRLIALSQNGDEARQAVFHGESIEVASVLIDQLGDEWGSPTWEKVVGIIECAEAGEECVDDPKAFIAEGKIVSVDATSDEAIAGEIASIVGFCGGDIWGDVVSGVQEVDLAARSDSNLIAGDGDPHDLVESVEGEAWFILGATDDDKLACLVGGDQDREVQLMQNEW